MKKAVYKATFPCDGVFLEHQEVEIQIDKKLARTRSRFYLSIHAIASPRLVALAVILDL